MKIYERFIPPKTDIALHFENFCKKHGIRPEILSSESREAPLPTLRKKFMIDAYENLTVTHQQIADVVGRSRENVTKYLGERHG